MHANPFGSQLERLARALTGEFGVKAICQGANAWVDGRQIVLPSLPEPINEDMERMAVGRLDHEMAHVAFWDFSVAEEFAKKHARYEGMFNVVEDALIERRAMQRWPGGRAISDAMFAQCGTASQHPSLAASTLAIIRGGIHVVWSRPLVGPPRDRQTMLAGFYCRTRTVGQTLAMGAGVPFWAPAGLLAIYPLLALRSRVLVKRRRRHQNLCTACGYSLKALSEPRCPECGHPVALPAMTTTDQTA